MLTKKELYKRITDISLIRGKSFLLRSGKYSNIYFDKYLFESDPTLLENIVVYMKGLIPKNTDLLGGLELGAIPICTLLSNQTNIPMVFIRKKAKKYGTRKLVEGPDIEGKNICVIEDVITTGGQVIESCKQMIVQGAKIDTVVCVFLRDIKALDNFHANSLSLKPLYTAQL